MKNPNSPEIKQLNYTGEILRKLTHLGALIVPYGYYLFNLKKTEILSILIPFTILVFFIDISRLRKWKIWTNLFSYIVKPMVRPKEDEGDFTGASYILPTFCLCIALFSKPIAVAAMSFIIVGDTLAALIGRKFGKIKFYKQKTVTGSLGCLAGMVVVAILTPDLNLTVALSGALVATVFEAYSLGTDDNVTVPLLSGLFMTLLDKILTFYQII